MDRPYRCAHDGCDKAYRTSEQLSRHRHVHGAHRFFCDRAACGKGFFETDALKGPRRAHAARDVRILADAAPALANAAAAGAAAVADAEERARQETRARTVAEERASTE